MESTCFGTGEKGENELKGMKGENLGLELLLKTEGSER